MNNLFLYLLTLMIWSTTWLAVEFQIPESGATVAPEVSVVYRYLIAALIIFSWCKLRGLNLKFDRNTHLLFLMLGLTLFCLSYICVYVGQGFIVSALMAIIYSTISWLNIFNARLFMGTRTGWPIVSGSILGMGGLGLIFWPTIKELSLADVTIIGGLIGFSGAYCASLGNMISQTIQKRNVPVTQTNAWAMLYGALLTGAFSIGIGNEFTFDSSPKYIGALVYLSVFGSVIAFWAYLTLLGRIGANRAGYITIVAPVIAVVISVVFEGLEFSTLLIIGVVLVLVGNLSILNSRQSAPRLSAEQH